MPAAEDDAESIGAGPVSVSARVTPSSARPGDIVTVTVTLQHAEGWHSYARVPRSSPYVTNRVELELPPELVPVGRWELPAGAPLAGEAGVLALEGRAVYRRHVRVAAGASGEADLLARVTFMTCDDMSCLPVESVAVTVSLDVTAATDGGGSKP